MYQKQKEKKFPILKRCSCQILHQAGFQNENMNSLPDRPTAPSNGEVKVEHFEIQYQRETHSMGSKPEKKMKHLRTKLKIILLHCKSIKINFTVQKKTWVKSLVLLAKTLFNCLLVYDISPVRATVTCDEVNK